MFFIEFRKKINKKINKSKATQIKDIKYKNHKEVARKLISEKLVYWNQLYDFQYNRVAIRNTKTRWGSCSSKLNLNFNYKLLFLPEDLLDYIIVHELCHLKEMNHSINFWNLVAKQIPDYRLRRDKLRLINLNKL